MSKQIHLHCPSTKRYADIVISPYQSPDQIYQGIRLALSISYASLYTTDAQPITKLDSLQDDQRVLVASSPSEHMLPDSSPEYEIYDGQEADAVDPDLDCFAQEWDILGEREKCEHVMSLTARKPRTRNKLRITRKWEAVLHELTAVQKGTGALPAAECENVIEQRWRMTVDHFFPDAMKPGVSKIKTDGKVWDQRVIAGLEILSSFTHGQARLAVEVLQEAVQMRMLNEAGVDSNSIVQLQDIVNAVNIVYERAGIIPAKVTKGKAGRGKGKEKRKALRGGKKGQGGVGM
ncbi:hypothetical protein EK21DRAFT_96008 [Setomelanomma holmii]|uniref:Uncharacterized protein n=1 Tax=Setomelanomma holmii TaxID=210430 RepID=A0A9P4HK92_9PLEO|nr:hypothetical protein EK21DRAFT_96008 [Setomelanomma holmii]